MSEKEYYELHIAGLTRKLQKFSVSDSLDIAAFILFGDVENNPLLFNVGTMLANQDSEDVRRVVAILEAVTESYFRK